MEYAVSMKESETMIAAGTKKKQLLRAEGRAAYICLIPSIIGLILLTYGPLLAVLILSFF